MLGRSRPKASNIRFGCCHSLLGPCAPAIDWCGRSSRQNGSRPADGALPGRPQAPGDGSPGVVPLAARTGPVSSALANGPGVMFCVSPPDKVAAGHIRDVVGHFSPGVALACRSVPVSLPWSGGRSSCSRSRSFFPSTRPSAFSCCLGWFATSPSTRCRRAFPAARPWATYGSTPSCSRWTSRGSRCRIATALILFDLPRYTPTSS